jgi:2-polyprenyl-6-methoxyphenol hydroxylase-like FAD-dependent oxidoreductase
MMADTVQVHLSDGDIQHWDLVIAADGLSSHHRAKYFPDAQPARFTGQGCWRVVLPRPTAIANRHFFLGGRCKLGLTPMSQEQMYLFLLEHVPKNPWRDPQTQHLILRDLLADYGGPLVQIRADLGPESGIVYRPLESHYLGQVWHRDRLILIGDAAHATTPQLAAGAGMGIEDGVVLGQELGRSQPLQQALQAFMRRRHDRCSMVVNNSLLIGQLEVEGASPEAQTALVNTSLGLLAEPI